MTKLTYLVILINGKCGFITIEGGKWVKQFLLCRKTSTIGLVKKTPLSVVIHTKNSADTLEATLKSAQFADEIVIVDMHSTDQTVKLAKQFTDHIYQHEDVGYADPARNFGQGKASHNWILVLDDDETVSPSLQQIILSTLEHPVADVYYLPRQNMVFGQWISKTGWWPDYQPRLFKKGSLSWQVGVHRPPDVHGTTEYFPAEEQYALLHANYTDVGHFIEKLNQYTSIQAKERLVESPQDNFSAQRLLEIFSGEFAKRALAMDGVEDGLHGVSLALLQSMYEAVIYLKQWGEKGFAPTTPENFGRLMGEFERTWHYWWADYQVRHARGLARIYWQIRRKLKV